jgi:hypothetical protein
MSTQQASSSLSRAIGNDPSGLLRLALRLDAAASGALGLLTLTAAPALAGLLGMPAALPWPLGLFLVAYAAALWVAASRPRVNRPFVWAVIVGNSLWVLASVAVVVVGPFALTGLGVAFGLVQAAAVALFADLQFLGVRRAQSAATA